MVYGLVLLVCPWILLACSGMPDLQLPTPTASTPLPTFTNTPLATSLSPELEPQSTPTATQAALVLLPTVTPVSAVNFDPQQHQLGLRPFLSDLDRPLFMTHAGDGSGRIFVVEKVGTIQVFIDGQQAPVSFLDLRDRVKSSGYEQGLLGLVFSPDFATSGYFFVNYTDNNDTTHIARFQLDHANPNRGDPVSEFTVLALEQPAINHNGGMLAFGPDGYLWVGLGDGGGANDTHGNAQNPDTLLGKMLRLDVTSDPTQPYLIPPDNPWVNATWNGETMRPEVWAVGLRNPWRYSFDRQTGDLWIADVGQSQYEEVNWIFRGDPGGLNFGWPITEGQHCRNNQDCELGGLMMPVAEYEHQGHCSITGGYVYRGSQFPALQGVYLYADFCSGVIWGAWRDAQGEQVVVELLDSEHGISSFGEDEAGELYITDLNNGEVLQVVLVE